MSIYGKHLERHRIAFERHQAGETYVSIAKDLKVSTPRVRQLALRWKLELEIKKLRERNKS